MPNSHHPISWPLHLCWSKAPTCSLNISIISSVSGLQHWQIIDYLNKINSFMHIYLYWSNVWEYFLLDLHLLVFFVVVLDDQLFCLEVLDRLVVAQLCAHEVTSLLLSFVCLQMRQHTRRWARFCTCRDKWFELLSTSSYLITYSNQINCSK